MSSEKLNVITKPRPPQRILLPPVAHKHASASDIPTYKETMYPAYSNKIEERCDQYIAAILKASNPNSEIVTSPCRVNKVPGRTKGFNISRGNWIDNLVGKNFFEAKNIIQTHRIPYRIIQIDNIVVDCGSPYKNTKELLVNITTNVNHQATEDANADRLRVSSWFSEHMRESIISKISLV
jgi:hypothetical protein